MGLVLALGLKLGLGLQLGSDLDDLSDAVLVDVAHRVHVHVGLAQHLPLLCIDRYQTVYLSPPVYTRVFGGETSTRTVQVVYVGGGGGAWYLRGWHLRVDVSQSNVGQPRLLEHRAVREPVEALEPPAEPAHQVCGGHPVVVHRRRGIRGVGVGLSKARLARVSS